MPTPLRSGAAFAAALCFVSLPASSHEGDPKLRDKRPRFEVSRWKQPGETQNLSIAAEYLVFPANNVQLMSWVSLRDFGFSHDNGNSCFGYTAPSGREYAILGTYRGTCFVEITDPGDPRIVGVINGPTSLWRDMRVYQDKCYAASEGGQGVQVIDLAQIDNGVVSFVTQVDDGPTHTLALNTASGFLYRSGGGDNGLRIYNLANPALPVFAGQWNTRYSHEAQVVTYTSGPYAGKEVAFSCGGFNGGFSQTGIDILDVTNKSSIQLIKRFFYSNAEYSHQGWLSSDKRYFYLNDELDENGANLMKTRVVDMQNLSNPVELPSFSTGSTAIDHNLYVNGNRIYQANYRSGLHVFDNTNPTAPTQVAWFDTWPDDEAAQFNSLWNNYPYFASGTVIGSDIEKGLFVWKIGAPELEFGFSNGVPQTFQPSGEDLALTLTQAVANTLLAGSATFHYDAGAGWVSRPLTLVGGTSYTAPFPTLACGHDISWYLSAKTIAGVTWTFPQGAPTLVRRATAASAVSLQSYQRFDTNAAWSVDPADSATGGRWMHGDPHGTYGQPEDDHSLVGINCWFTGQGSQFGQTGDADVDGGATTLWSSNFDLTALADPVISYWRWFSTNVSPLAQQDDVFVVDISNDGGASWSNVEVVGPTGPGISGGWIQHQVRVRDHFAPSANVRLRFVASDFGVVTNVEAAIDDVAVADIACPPVAVSYCVAKTNSQGCVPAIGFSGNPSATQLAPFDVSATLILSNKPGVLFYGRQRATTPFQGGTLCVGGSVRRTPIQQSNGNFPPVDCTGEFHFDFNAWVRSGADPSLVVGDTIDAQYWYRDPNDPAGFGSGLSNALEFTIAP